LGSAIPTTITVRKLDHAGNLVTSYQGQVIRRDATSIALEARWQRDRRDLGYLVLELGDRFIEFFFADRWYNVFEIHAGADDRLKGWYCNIARPGVFADDILSAVDLALDLFVYPDGRTLTLDQDEFDALNLQRDDPEAWRRSLAAVDELETMVAARRAPFDAIPD
jgi:predicted RNA-binding protein associated with RNAse of E/G family